MLVEPIGNGIDNVRTWDGAWRVRDPALYASIAVHDTGVDGVVLMTQHTRVGQNAGAG